MWGFGPIIETIMKKKVKVKAHNRKGVVVEEHERIVDGDEDSSLKKRITDRKNTSVMSSTLFSFSKEES